MFNDEDLVLPGSGKSGHNYAQNIPYFKLTIQKLLSSLYVSFNLQALENVLINLNNILLEVLGKFL